MDYMISIKETDLLQKELEEAKKDLEQLKGIREKRRQKRRLGIMRQLFWMEQIKCHIVFSGKHQIQIIILLIPLAWTSLKKIIWKINCWKICRRMKRHFILNI